MTAHSDANDRSHFGAALCLVALALCITPAPTRAETCDSMQDRLRALDQREAGALAQALTTDLLGMTANASGAALCLAAERLTLEASFYQQCFAELGYTKLRAGEIARDRARRAALANAGCPSGK